MRSVPPAGSYRMSGELRVIYETVASRQRRKKKISIVGNRNLVTPSDDCTACAVVIFKCLY
jgi:hypothetical protein